MLKILNDMFTALVNSGVDLIGIADISNLPADKSRGFNNALLFGITLSPGYIRSLLIDDVLNKKEFLEKESKADALADFAEAFLIGNGYDAFSQSERNLCRHGLYDAVTQTTPLPHKEIAVMAGIGWIGKNDLLIIPDYGCAISMCTVLTNAPLPVKNKLPMSQGCRECSVCIDICSPKALHGSLWSPEMKRERIVDVERCDSCLKCLAHCPWTRRYAKRSV